MLNCLPKLPEYLSLVEIFDREVALRSSTVSMSTGIYPVIAAKEFSPPAGVLRGDKELDYR
jgi:hypothetical protein